MGDEENKSENPEVVANGTSLPEKPAEAVAGKKERKEDGVQDMDEDGKGDGMKTMDEDKKTDADTEVKEDNDAVAEKGKDKNKEKEEKEENGSKEDDGTEEKEEKDDEVKEAETEEVPKSEETKVAKGSNRRARSKSGGVEGKEKKSRAVKTKKEPPPRTPATIDRPQRERKSVERLVASTERDTSRELQIEKVFFQLIFSVPILLSNCEFCVLLGCHLVYTVV